VVGDEAHVDHVKLIVEGDKALHVSTLLATIGAHARFNSFTFTTGGAVVRNQIFLRFDGMETVAGIRGASLLKASSMPTPRCGWITGGRLPEPRIVQVGARRRQPRRLPGQDHRRAGRAEDRRQDGDAGAAPVRRAEADNKPELGDLRRRRACGHGATAGALDETCCSI
jgi:Fe-S cluster assembly protein SufD